MDNGQPFNYCQVVSILFPPTCADYINNNYHKSKSDKLELKYLTRNKSRYIGEINRLKTLFRYFQRHSFSLWLTAKNIGRFTDIILSFIGNIYITISSKHHNIQWIILLRVALSLTTFLVVLGQDRSLGSLLCYEHSHLRMCIYLHS